MFANVLIANRGEIACRIIRTALPHGDQADRAPYARGSRRGCSPGSPTRPMKSARGRAGYLDGPAIIALARRMGPECLHPGYGFLSENADFAEACARGRRRVRRAAARGDARDGAEELSQGADAESRRSHRPGLPRRQPESEVLAREGIWSATRC